MEHRTSRSVSVCPIVVSLSVLAVLTGLKYFTSDPASTSPSENQTRQPEVGPVVRDGTGTTEGQSGVSVNAEVVSWETHKDDVQFWCAHVNQGMTAACIELLDKVFLDEKPYREGIVPIADWNPCPSYCRDGTNGQRWDNLRSGRVAAIHFGAKPNRYIDCGRTCRGNPQAIRIVQHVRFKLLPSAIAFASSSRDGNSGKLDELVPVSDC